MYWKSWVLRWHCQVSSVFMFFITIGQTGRVVLCAFKLVSFLVWEWQVFIELLKTYNKIEKYSLKAPSPLKNIFKEFKTKFGSVWDPTTFLTNLPRWWIGQNQLYFSVCFVLRQETQISYILQDGRVLNSLQISFVTSIFCTPSSSRHTNPVTCGLVPLTDSQCGFSH